jgi:hypothetical protein
MHRIGSYAIISVPPRGSRHLYLSIDPWNSNHCSLPYRERYYRPPDSLKGLRKPMYVLFSYFLAILSFHHTTNILKVESIMNGTTS